MTLGPSPDLCEAECLPVDVEGGWMRSEVLNLDPGLF